MGIRHIIGLGMLGLLWGCGNGDVPARGNPLDCRENGIGCSPGFACVSSDGGIYECEPSADASVTTDGSVTTADAMVASPDASQVDAAQPDAMSPDAMVMIPDAAMPDGDGDGAPDGADNCPDLANADQADSDNDGLGDACDGEPNVQNFIMTGHFLTLGGRSVDDNHTLKSKITTGAGESTDGQLIMTGEIQP